MLGTFILSSFVITIQANMESYIVGGTPAFIAKYPFSGFLTVFCHSNQEYHYWGCGSSLLNQKILITAGHCVYPCETSTSSMKVNLGSENNERGISIAASGFVLHEKYEFHSATCDIALIKLKTPVQLNSYISRVAIMPDPPYTEQAKVAGWGLNDELHGTSSNDLLVAGQKVWQQSSCQKLLKDMPRGTICASNDNKKIYPAKGDSGSPLVVRGYIQIGLVSYKVSNIAVNVVIYTDIGYHYQWIELHSRRLYCSSASKNLILRNSTEK